MMQRYIIINDQFKRFLCPISWRHMRMLSGQLYWALQG